MFFEREYFKPEVREGFYVSSRMKRTWAATLEVFDTVRKVCEAHGIRYYADWGTMLGAVRHGGFIPWDDDLDICMLRKDYMEFLQIAEEALPEEYAVFNMYTEASYTNLLTRVIDRRRLPETKEELEKSHGYPFVAGIDIYPLDYVCRDKNLEDAKWDAIGLMKLYADMYDAKEMIIDEDRGGDNIREITRMFGVGIQDDKPVRQQLYQMIDIVAAMYGEDQGDYVSTMSDETKGKPIPASYYSEYIDIPFECTTITVPILYDAMLETKYPGYMRIVKSWDTHEYPVYRGIEEEVRSQGGTTVWKYYAPDDARADIVKQQERNNRDCGKNNSNSDIVFMPHDTHSWRMMEPLWAMLTENPDLNIYVMPVPYYLKNDMGEPDELHFEGSKLPYYVDTLPFDSYDLERRHPSRIVIGIPYDQYDTSVTLPEIFYSGRLRSCTDCLTYISDLSIDDFGAEDGRSVINMDYYCTIPGVINSDEVYVGSENMRNIYIEKLTEFVGEGYRDYFEKKIVQVPWDVNEMTDYGINEEDIPDGWWAKLLDENGEGKKLILYYNSMSCIARYKDRYIDKINKAFSLFNENRDRLTVMWVRDRDIDVLKDNGYTGYTKTVERFRQLEEKYAEQNNVILYKEDNMDKAIAICDAFYGDRGVLMNRFRRTGRPVMIQNVEL